MLLHWLTRQWWRGLDSNQRTLARADLQSAAFNHSATSPEVQAGAPCGGAPKMSQRASGAFERAGPCAARATPRELSVAYSNTSTWRRRVGAGAGEGNRTLVVSLEGFCSTIELHPLEPRPCHWRGEAVNRRGVDGQRDHELGGDSNDAPERHRRFLDRSPLVARFDLCGAMARLID